MQTKQLHVIPHTLFPRLPTPARPLAPSTTNHQNITALRGKHLRQARAQFTLKCPRSEECRLTNAETH